MISFETSFHGDSPNDSPDDDDEPVMHVSTGAEEHESTHSRALTSSFGTPSPHHSASRAKPALQMVSYASALMPVITEVNFADGPPLAGALSSPDSCHPRRGGRARS